MNPLSDWERLAAEVVAMRKRLAEEVVEGRIDSFEQYRGKTASIRTLDKVLEVMVSIEGGKALPDAKSDDAAEYDEGDHI